MRIERVMTRDVLTVAPETPIKEVASLLTSHRISGAPVCDADGAVVGVISEADILHRVEGAPELRGRLAWLFRQLDDGIPKLTARTAEEAMTAPALTVRPTQQVAEAAQLMLDHRVNRLPVVARGSLVGIVSRADVLRAFERPDVELEREIREDVLRGALWLTPETFDVRVVDGAASLRGRVPTRRDAEDVVRLVRRVPGVLSVSAELVAPE
ncbi:MAG TPA: CBS domain-containing protein [Gaiellaceae bacterium]|nr:CBS domain-containing protein [Gaiellaceae bacterium]